MTIVGGCSFYCLIAFHLNAVLANINHEIKERVGQYDRTGGKKGLRYLVSYSPKHDSAYVEFLGIRERAQQSNEL